MKPSFKLKDKNGLITHNYEMAMTPYDHGWLLAKESLENAGPFARENQISFIEQTKSMYIEQTT